MLARHDGPCISSVCFFKPSTGKLRSEGRVFDQSCYGGSPLCFIFFADDEPGIPDHVRYLSAAATDYRDAAGESFDQHPTKLLAPAGSSLTRRAQDVHRVQVRRDFGVLYTCDYLRASG